MKEAIKGKENISQASSGLIEIGKIVAPVGIKGEVKVYNYSEGDARYGQGKVLILIKPDGTREESTVQSSRLQGTTVVVKFSGIADRNWAEAHRGWGVYIKEEELEELPEDTYYVRDIEGLTVFNDADGREVGVVEEVIQYTAQDIYRVSLISGPEEKAGEVLVPAVKEFIKEVAPEKGLVRIAFIPGMLPE